MQPNIKKVILGQMQRKYITHLYLKQGYWWEYNIFDISLMSTVVLLPYGPKRIISFTLSKLNFSHPQKPQNQMVCGFCSWCAVLTLCSVMWKIFHSPSLRHNQSLMKCRQYNEIIWSIVFNSHTRNTKETQNMNTNQVLTTRKEWKSIRNTFVDLAFALKITVNQKFYVSICRLNNPKFDTE